MLNALGSIGVLVLIADDLDYAEKKGYCRQDFLSMLELQIKEPRNQRYECHLDIPRV